MVLILGAKFHQQHEDGTVYAVVGFTALRTLKRRSGSAVHPASPHDDTEWACLTARLSGGGGGGGDAWLTPCQPVAYTAGACTFATHLRTLPCVTTTLTVRETLRGEVTEVGVHIHPPPRDDTRSPPAPPPSSASPPSLPCVTRFTQAGVCITRTALQVAYAAQGSTYCLVADARPCGVDATAHVFGWGGTAVAGLPLPHGTSHTTIGGGTLTLYVTDTDTTSPFLAYATASVTILPDAYWLPEVGHIHALEVCRDGGGSVSGDEASATEEEEGAAAWSLGLSLTDSRGGRVVLENTVTAAFAILFRTGSVRGKLGGILPGQSVHVYSGSGGDGYVLGPFPPRDARASAAYTFTGASLRVEDTRMGGGCSMLLLRVEPHLAHGEVPPPDAHVNIFAVLLRYTSLGTRAPRTVSCTINREAHAYTLPACVVWDMDPSAPSAVDVHCFEARTEEGTRIPCATFRGLPITPPRPDPSVVAASVPPPLPHDARLEVTYVPSTCGDVGMRVGVTLATDTSSSPGAAAAAAAAADTLALRVRTADHAYVHAAWLKSGCDNVVCLDGLPPLSSVPRFELVAHRTLPYGMSVVHAQRVGRCDACLCGSTHVLSGDGCTWVRVQDVREGDAVRTPDGRTVRVVRVCTYRVPCVPPSAPRRDEGRHPRPLPVHALFALPVSASASDASSPHDAIVSRDTLVWDAHARTWSPAHALHGSRHVSGCTDADGTHATRTSIPVYSISLPDADLDALVLSHGHAIACGGARSPAPLPRTEGDAPPAWRHCRACWIRHFRGGDSECAASAGVKTRQRRGKR